MRRHKEQEEQPDKGARTREGKRRIKRDIRAGRRERRN